MEEKMNEDDDEINEDDDEIINQKHKLNNEEEEEEEKKKEDEEEEEKEDEEEDKDSQIYKYYELKKEYEEYIKKKTIKIKNSKLSKKEKRNEYLKFKPKCINCNKPGGTIFSIKFDKNENKRILRAKCGNISNPCDLNIEIHLNNFFNLQTIILQKEKLILDFKNIIINNKNKLLFGYITAEKVLQNFELIKEDLDFALQELNYYLDDYNNIINIDINKQILDFDKIELNQLIQQLKKAIEINDFDESINIYITKLKPLLNKILNLKYKNSQRITLLIEKVSAVAIADPIIPYIGIKI